MAGQVAAPARPDRRRSRLGAALVSVAAIALPAFPATADITDSAVYEGPSYPPGRTHLTPTAAKPQNKLWWHDGRWWTLHLTESGTVKVVSLEDDHSWGVTKSNVVKSPFGVGDVVAAGPSVHVLTRTTAGLVLRTLRYDKDAGAYRPQGQLPTVIVDKSSNTAALDRDSQGRLWAAYVDDGRVWVARSAPETAEAPTGTSWGIPYAIPGQGRRLRSGEIADVVAYDQHVGVLWSDQRRGEFRFAAHELGTPTADWSIEVALAGRSLADDHISATVLQQPGDDVVLAAVKTSLDDDAGVDAVTADADAPLVLVLRRNGPDGWTQHLVATVEEQWTRPVIATDVTDTAYVVARARGRIVGKSAAVASLDFPAGPGAELMSVDGASLTDPTVPAQRVGPRCGLVVLASDVTRRRYWHGEFALEGDGKAARSACAHGAAAVQPPTVDSATAGSGGVRLSWSAGDQGWTPADTQLVGMSYAIERDGERVGTTNATTYVDQPDGDGRFAYRVVALDETTGTEAASEPARVRVRAATGDGALAATRRVIIAGAGVAVLLLLLTVLVLRFRAQRRTHDARVRVAETVLALPAPPQPRGKHARRAAPSLAGARTGAPRAAAPGAAVPGPPAAVGPAASNGHVVDVTVREPVPAGDRPKVPEQVDRPAGRHRRTTES